MPFSSEDKGKPFSIFRVEPGSIPDVNLWLMRHVFKYLAEAVFIDVKLPDPVTMKNPDGIKFSKFYDNEGEYVKRLKISFVLEFEPAEKKIKETP